MNEINEIQRILEKLFKKVMETLRGLHIAADLPDYKKQTLKSQMHDRWLIVKLGAAWSCLMGRPNIIF